MSKPWQNIFDLDDLDSQEYPALNTFVRTYAQHVTVEFLQQGGAKPHVVFHVNSDRPTAVDRTTVFKGCILGMDYTGPGYEGTFTIKLIPYSESSHSAHAAFQFPLNTVGSTILDWINIFRGRYHGLPPQHAGDLTSYDFVQPHPTVADLDGCRDFITQCFIRLYSVGIIGWESNGQGVGQIDLIDLNRHVPTNGFHHIIPHDYKMENATASGIRPCRITELPLNRGVFRNHQVHRHETYTVNNRTVQLPYVPMPTLHLPPTTGDGPSGGASGRGRNQGDPRSQYPSYPSGSSAGAGGGYASGSGNSGQGRHIPGAYGYSDNTSMSSRQSRDRVALKADKDRPSRQATDQRQKDSKGQKDTKAGTGSKFGSLFSRSKHVDEAAEKSHHPGSKSHVSNSSKAVNGRAPNGSGGHVAAARPNSQDPRHHNSRQPHPGSYPVDQRSTSVRHERVTANPPSGLVHRYKDTKPDPRAQDRSRNDQYSTSAKYDTKDPKYATDPRYARDPKYTTDPRYAAKPAPHYSSSSNPRDRVQY